MKRQVTHIAEQHDGAAVFFKTRTNPTGSSVSVDKLEADFSHVGRKVIKASHATMSQDTLLELYAWYKQAAGGDVSGDRPSALSIKARAKFDAWSKVKGTSRNQAMLEYIMAAMAALTSQQQTA